MPHSNVCWGIEIGAGAIKALKLVRDGQNVTVADFAVVPHAKVLSSPDVDQADAIRVALGDHQPRLGAGRVDDAGDVPADGEAVQQHERGAAAPVDLVVHIEPVDGCVPRCRHDAVPLMSGGGLSVSCGAWTGEPPVALIIGSAAGGCFSDLAWL